MPVQGDFRIDLDKYYRIEFRGRPPGLRRRVKLWLTHFGFQCVAIYRLGRFCRDGRRRGNPLAWALSPCAEVLCFLVKLLFQVDVFAADIGPGFYIGHVGTLYIGPTVVGANFSVTHNVTVGMGASGGTHGLPVLGCDVWLGTGSILYGGITVGNGVTVNSGTVLSRNIPDRCLVGGNPGRVILRGYDNARLFALPGVKRAVPQAYPQAAPESVPQTLEKAMENAMETAMEKAVQTAVEEAVPVTATTASAAAAMDSVVATAAMASAAMAAAQDRSMTEGKQAGTRSDVPAGVSTEPLKN